MTDTYGAKRLLAEKEQLLPLMAGIYSRKVAKRLQEGARFSDRQVRQILQVELAKKGIKTNPTALYRFLTKEGYRADVYVDLPPLKAASLRTVKTFDNYSRGMDRAEYEAHEPTARAFLETTRKAGKPQIFFKHRHIIEGLWRWMNMQPVSTVDTQELLDYISFYQGQVWNPTTERWDKRKKTIQKKAVLRGIRQLWRYGLATVDRAKYGTEPPMELEIGGVGAGVRREMYLTPHEIQAVLDTTGLNALLLHEKAAWTQHITGGGREGGNDQQSLLGMRWEDVDWQKKTVTMHEPKTKAAPAWLDVPLDLFREFGWFEDYFIPYWEAQGRPTEGWMWRRPDGRRYRYRRDYLGTTWRKIRLIVGEKKAREYVRDPMTGNRSVVFFDKKFTPHDMRRTHVQLCRLAGIPMEIIAGDAPLGVVGVGWEDLTTLKKFYGAFNEEDITKNRALAAKVSLEGLHRKQTDMEKEPTGQTLKQEREGLP